MDKLFQNRKLYFGILQDISYQLKSLSVYVGGHGNMVV